MTETIYVRLKPYNAKKKHLVRSYMYRGSRFDGTKGWYQIEDVAFAEELRALRQNAYDDDSQPLFDVCTKAEALELEKRERMVKELAGPRSVDAAAEEAVEGRRTRKTLEAARTQARTNALTTDDLKPEELERARKKLLDPGDEVEEDETDETPAGPAVVTEVGRLADDDAPPPARTPRASRVPGRSSAPASERKARDQARASKPGKAASGRSSRAAKE